MAAVPRPRADVEHDLAGIAHQNDNARRALTHLRGQRAQLEHQLADIDRQELFVLAGIDARHARADRYLDELTGGQ
jgi:phage shock protein A